MAAREPTSVEALRELAHVVPPSLHPTLTELPALFAAMVEGSRVDGLLDKVGELRQQGASDVEIAQEVSHLIAPPDPDAGATVVHGVPPEAHQAVLDELAQLRQAIDELRNPPPAAPDAQPAGPVANTQQLTPEQQELQRLREEVQSLRIREATAGHPTATVEPEPTPAAPESPAAPSEAG